MDGMERWTRGRKLRNAAEAASATWVAELAQSAGELASLTGWGRGHLPLTALQRGSPWLETRCPGARVGSSC